MKATPKHRERKLPTENEPSIYFVLFFCHMSTTSQNQGEQVSTLQLASDGGQTSCPSQIHLIHKHNVFSSLLWYLFHSSV